MNTNYQTPQSDSLPIHNEQIERMVLASIINNYQDIAEVINILTPDCFYNLNLRDVYSAILAIYNRGDAPDLLLLQRELSCRESPFTMKDLLELCNTQQQAFDVIPHARLLQEYQYRRKLWQIGQTLVAQSVSEKEMVEAVHNQAKSELDTLFEVGTEKLVSLDSVYQSLQGHMIANLSREEGETYGSPTGFPDIDRMGGLVGSDLIIVGADTSQGKTSFAIAMTIAAISHGDGVAFYSMEMTSLQLAARIASMKSGIPVSRIMFDQLSYAEISMIDNAMLGVDMTKLYLDETSTSSLDSILMSIRKMKLKHDIKGACVDYLQLVQTLDKSLNREQSMAHISRQLKNLAKELDIWIVAISQINRNDQNPVPSKNRLRDSGQIGEAADIIFLIYRPKDGNKYPAPFTDKSTDGTAMVMIAKGRNIGEGAFLCGFKAENTLFYPVDENEIAGIGEFSAQFPQTKKSFKEENDTKDLPF